MKIVNEKLVTLNKNEIVELNTVCNGIWCNSVKMDIEALESFETLLWISANNIWWKEEARGMEEQFMVVHWQPNKAIIKIRELEH